jgi:hypothetical protein
MYFDIASNGLSSKWARLYSTCWALCMSKKLTARLAKQSISSDSVYYYIVLSSILSFMYPHTPPTFWLFSNLLYILRMELCLGYRPTSRRTAYLGCSSLQNPLKNQRWEDIFPWFWYFTQKNKFINKSDEFYLRRKSY